MTLNDIIVNALMQMDRGHDAQTLDIFFLTKGGLCIFNGVNAQTMADARRIQGILKNSSTADSRGAICRDKLYFTISENNKCAMIEYDLTRGAYMLRRGFTAYDICSKGGTG